MILTAYALALAACVDEPATGWRIAPDGDLNAFFDCVSDQGAALISAHRGGPRAGFPENALETMQAALEEIPALLEIDVAQSADGVLYLMHDRTLDRTTNGEGEVNERNWDEIAALRLKDEDGRLTQFSPPRLDEALRWARGRTILKLDIKRSARYEAVIDAVRRQGAEESVILIAYSLSAATRLHRLAPEMMISLNIKSPSEQRAAAKAGLPSNRLMAFTGKQPPHRDFVEDLEADDIEVILATLGGRSSIDADIARRGNDRAYSDFAARGIDVLSTDRPYAAYKALHREGRSAAGACGIAKISAD